MRRSFTSIMFGGVLMLGLASAAAEPGDPNTDAAQAGREASGLEALARALDPEALAEISDLCGIAFLPGPAGSVDITIELINLNSERLEVAIIDTFEAFGRESLLIESVFMVVPPDGGTAEVLYPDGAPVGPAVLTFADFNDGDSASFSLDPDTYDDPAFGATVENMNRSKIEAVYSGDLRCVGQLLFNPILEASVALLYRNSPAP